MAFPLHTERLCSSHTLSRNSLPFLYIFLASIHSPRSFTSFNDLLLQRWTFLSVYYVSPLSVSLSFLCSGITASHSLFKLFVISVFSFSLHTFLYLTLSLIFIRPSSFPTSTLSILRISYSPLSLSPGGDRSLPYSLRPALPKKMDSSSLIPCGAFYGSHTGADARTVTSMKE